MRCLPFSVVFLALGCSVFPETAPMVGADTGGAAGVGGTAGLGGTVNTGGAGGSGNSGGSSGAATGGAGGAAGCPAKNLTLSASRDTFIVSSPPKSTHGSEDFILIRAGSSNGTSRGLVGFDFDAVPTSASVSQATLEFRVTLNEGAVFELGAYRVKRHWNESASWDRYDSNSDWSQSGGDYEAVSAQTAVDKSTGVVSLDLTGDVTKVLDGSFQNEGWLLKPVSASGLSGERLELGSRERGSPDERPKLRLTYTDCN